MANNKFIFTEELAEILASIRKKARLFQADVANRIGLSAKSGKKYISYLETGRIKNPSLSTIILYLDACNTPYNTFFSKLSELRFREAQQEIMDQVKLPTDTTISKKASRDTALYAEKIKYQNKTPMLDYDKLKSKIDRIINQYLSDHKVDQSLFPIYQDFTSYVLTRVLNPNPNPPLDITPWNKTGIRPILLESINRMIYKIVRNDQKKLTKRRIPTTEKQKRMVIGFLKYRVMIEQVEAEVHKLLNELQVPLSLYHAYKDFARGTFSNLKKLYFKDQSLLSQRFAESIKGWKESKLDENILEKVKEITIKEFQKVFKGETVK